MVFVSFIMRFLAVVAMLGVLVIPVSAVAAGNAMTSDPAVMQSMASMKNMPCCPGEKQAKPDCGKDCPLVVICMASNVLNLARVDWVPAALHWSYHDYGSASAETLASIPADPPVRPPRA
jgi:hypothetical protein